MNTRRLLGSLTLVALVSMAACSNSSKDAAISKAEFLTKGNAICATLNAHLDELSAAVATEDDAVAYLSDELVPGLTDTVGQIRALGFPAGDEALLDGLMDELLVSREPARGRRRLDDWLLRSADGLGTTYASELSRHFR